MGNLLAPFRSPGGGGYDLQRILLAFVVLAGLIIAITLGAIYGPRSKNSDDEDNPYYLAAGNGESTTKTLLWSGNGTEWNATSGAFEGSGRYVRYYYGTNAPAWLAVGTDSADIKGTILWSDDGKTWNKILTGGFGMGTGDSDGGYSIAYDSSSGIFVATGGIVDGGEVTSTIQWSANGKNWNDAESGGFTSHGTEVYFDDNVKRFVVLGVDDDLNKTIQYSADGKNWTGSSGATFNASGGLSVIGRNR